MADYDYDMLVIGSGPAGQRAAIQTGLLKLIFHLETHELLCRHIIGESASELIHIRAGGAGVQRQGGILH